MSNPAGIPGDRARPTNRARAPAVSAAIRVLPAIAAALLFGCQSLPWQDDPPPVEADPEPEQPAPAPDPAPTPSIEPSLASVIELLQRGREDEALRVLDALEENGQGSEMTDALRRQVIAPIDELIPGPYREIEVQPGETLSEIAAEALGDPLMFFALARLNEIRQPRLVGVGRVLRVPVEPPFGQPTATPEQPVVQRDESSTPAASARERDIGTVADYMVRSGQASDAWRMLVLEVESGNAGDGIKDSLVRLTLDRASELQRRGRFDSALDGLSRAIAALGPEHSGTGVLAERKTRVRVAQWSERAREAQERGDDLEAHEWAMRAAEPGIDPEAADRLAEIREGLIERLHNEALVAWRDRDVDRAIRTWESLLDAVPDFEPAAVYLERARQLRERLDRP